MAKNPKKLEALQAFCPAVNYDINGVTVVIEPLRLKHSGDFAKIVGKVLPSIMQASTAAKEDDALLPILQAALPVIFSDLVFLCDKCVDVDLTEIPQEFVPQIVDRWIEVSFGDEGKVKPWKDLFVSLQKRFAQSPPEASTSSAT